ncbi:hypothetical protein PAPYR_4707 [Paratrimastix pyriformis]|uniref:Uncharacterized protein n=1 Tax=Paratrimastix pyriformis TaxID=342808 RepID=A0ABQ8UJK2_9EUKA|nr:hypothetical protein PAPYR_4707 [Paratrimastix pyriformis]
MFPHPRRALRTQLDLLTKIPIHGTLFWQRFGTHAFLFLVSRQFRPCIVITLPKIVDFTSDLTAIRAAIGSRSPEGGGDGPEARDSAPKIIIFIAGSPPCDWFVHFFPRATHELPSIALPGEGGDGFPDKDPAGCDLLELIQSFEKLIVHVVGCEPPKQNERGSPHEEEKTGR